MKPTKTTSSSRKLIQPAVLAIVIACVISVRPAQGFTITLDQVGSNVVATGSGAFDLTGLNSLGSAAENGGAIIPSFGYIDTWGNTTGDFYNGFTGPASFGSGGVSLANTGSGDHVFINAFSGQLFVPHGYVSGAALSDSMTFNSATFASLGVTPGTYEWTWGTGVNQNFTLQIGPAGVPDSGSTFGLLLLAVATLFGVSRFRSPRLA